MLDILRPVVTPIGILKSTNGFRGHTLSEKRQISGRTDNADSDSVHTDRTSPSERPSVVISSTEDSVELLGSCDSSKFDKLGLQSPSKEPALLGRGRSCKQWQEWVTVTAPFGRPKVTEDMSREKLRSSNTRSYRTHRTNQSVKSSHTISTQKYPSSMEEECNFSENEEAVNLAGAVSSRLQKTKPLRFLTKLYGDPTHVIKETSDTDTSTNHIHQPSTPYAEGNGTPSSSIFSTSSGIDDRVRISPRTVDFGLLKTGIEYAIPIEVQNICYRCQYVSVRWVEISDSSNENCRDASVRVRYYSGRLAASNKTKVIVLVRNKRPGKLLIHLQLATGTKDSVDLLYVPVSAKILSEKNFRAAICDQKNRLNRPRYRESQAKDFNFNDRSEASIDYENDDDEDTSKTPGREFQPHAYIGHLRSNHVRGDEIPEPEQDNSGSFMLRTMSAKDSTERSPLFPRTRSSPSAASPTGSRTSKSSPVQELIKTFDLDHAMFVGTDLEDEVARVNMDLTKHERATYETHPDILGVMTQPPLETTVRRAISPQSHMEAIITQEDVVSEFNSGKRKEIEYFPQLLVPGGLSKGGTNKSVVPVIEVEWTTQDQQFGCSWL